MVSNIGTLYNNKSQTVVTVRHDRLWPALEWAKKYCPSYITNDLHMDGYNTHDSTRIDYFFSDPEDAVAFKLKFGV